MWRERRGSSRGRVLCSRIHCSNPCWSPAADRCAQGGDPGCSVRGSPARPWKHCDRQRSVSTYVPPLVCLSDCASVCVCVCVCVRVWCVCVCVCVCLSVCGQVCSQGSDSLSLRKNDVLCVFLDLQQTTNTKSTEKAVFFLRNFPQNEQNVFSSLTNTHFCELICLCAATKHDYTRGRSTLC